MTGTGRESKPHVGIFGRRNNGKSSLINLLTGQQVAIVSAQAGTTTDPVKKSFEIMGFGPVILIDTAGIDDTGELGAQRVERAMRTAEQIDLALLVVAANGWGPHETQLVEAFREAETPCIVVHSKRDVEPLSPALRQQIETLEGISALVEVSATQPFGRDQLIEAIGNAIPEASLQAPTLLGGLVGSGQIVLLITPIDTLAPAGRLILPQVQAIRDALDNHAIAIVLKESELAPFLANTPIKPALAVTDSQVFDRADAAVPRDVPLTSFSILLARLKGCFDHYLRGTPAISLLRNGDRVLLLESCTHQVSCEDIGRVKIPRWLSGYTGQHLEFDMVAGLDAPPRPIGQYALVIQCGGCMITRKQIRNRLRPAIQAGVPVTNYGMAIAYVHGVYHRAVAPFGGCTGSG